MALPRRRVVLPLVALAGSAVVVSKVVRVRRFLAPVPDSDPWPPVAAPAPAAEEVEGVAASTPAGSYAEPAPDGACPATHPVKAKLASGIYHLPGMLAYRRTRADRCYPDATAAEGDGFVRAKR